MSTDTVETPTAPAVESAANTQIAVREPVALGSHGIKLTTLDELWRFAKIVATTDFVPKDFRGKPESTMIAIQYGMEVALTPMMALQTIGVINGKPGLHTDGPLAVVRGSGLLKEISEGLVVRTGDNLACSCVRWARDGECIHVRAATVKFANPAEERVAVCLVHRRGAADPHIQTFGVVDAKQAKLWMRTGREGQSTPWVTHPDTMLKFKARGFALRDEFGDILKGLRSREELEEFGLDDLPPNGSDDDTSSTPPAKNRVDAMKERLAAAQGRPVDGRAAADDALDSAARATALGADPEPDAIDAEEEKPEPSTTSSEPAAAAEPAKKTTSRSKTVETPQPQKPDPNAKISKIGVKHLTEGMDGWPKDAVREFLAEFNIDLPEDLQHLPASLYRKATAYVDDYNAKNGKAQAEPIGEEGGPFDDPFATDTDVPDASEVINDQQERDLRADATKRKVTGPLLDTYLNCLGVSKLGSLPVALFPVAQQWLVCLELIQKTGSELSQVVAFYKRNEPVEMSAANLTDAIAKLTAKASRLPAQS